MKKAAYGSRKKYHYLYKTVNLKNNKVYYGMHSTDNLKDGYIGSGTYLRRSIKKYGKEDFKIEILKYFNSREELIKAEKEIITEEMVKDVNCYNLKPGGSGGFINEEHAYKFRAAGGRAVRKLFRNLHLKKMQEDIDYRLKFCQAVKDFYLGRSGNFTGRAHTEETKEKMSLAKKGKYKGENNSQYGTCWITDEVKNKKINKGDRIPKGYTLGRTVKQSK